MPLAESNSFFDKQITPAATSKIKLWRDKGQRGYVNLGGGKKGLVLIDYDAVRPPHLVERNLKKRWS